MRRSDPLDRARGRRRGRGASAWCSRCSTARSRRSRGSCTSTRRRPNFDLQDARRQDDQLGAAAGQDVRRELLQQLVHPVPAGGARARRRSTPSTRPKPTSRWSGSSSTTTRRPMRGYVRKQGITWPVGVDPQRRGVARLRHHRSTRDVRHRARRRRGVRNARRVDAGRARHLAPGRAQRPRVRVSSRDDESRKLVLVVGAGRRRRHRVVVLVVRSRPDNSPRPARIGSSTSSRARCARASRSPTATPRSRGRSATTSPRRIAAGQSDAEIRAVLRVEVRREDAGDARRTRASASWRGACPRWRSSSAASGIVVAVRRWSHTPRLAATDEDEDIVRRAREHEHDETGE